VVFGPLCYGGLCLPDLYTDQSYGQLTLLLGHLGKKDEDGTLILIAISYLQLHTGYATPFFELPYPYYAKWIDSNWLTSIWKYTSQLHLTIEVDDHWLPTSVWQNDKILMDVFLQFNFHHKSLAQINLCRIYLQVLSVSDITSTDGKTLLASAIAGVRDVTCTSTLTWLIKSDQPRLHGNSGD
jgi:hypothetical protein